LYTIACLKELLNFEKGHVGVADIWRFFNF